MPIINWILNSSLTTKLVLLGFLLFVIAGGYVGCLTHRARVAERESKKAQEEQKRLQQQNEGLKILTNTANIAGEIEKQKEVADAQQTNSNIANNNYANNRLRDSKQSSNDFNVARRRFCEEFPTDSICR